MSGAPGVAAGHDNVVVIKIGTGIGAGIISNGRLHRGAQGSAGDVGHIQVVDDPSVVCRCGNVGCLEALAGGAALGRAGEAAALRARARGCRRRSTSTARDARTTSRGPLRSATRWRWRCSSRPAAGSAWMLASVVNFFNPSLIVIGGGVAQSGDQLLASIRETVYRRSLPLATRDLVIQRSSLGGLAGVIGASAMVVDQLFSRESIGPLARAGETAAAADPRRGARRGGHEGRPSDARVTTSTKSPSSGPSGSASGARRAGSPA